MCPKAAPELQMTIEELLAFTATRPDDERWELIEGVPVMNASPVQFHQIIAGNILNYLLTYKVAHGSTWLPMIGVGTRVPASPRSLPRPDLFVQEGPATERPDTDDAIVLIEVLSPSNDKADQAWRRLVYASIPNCQHYVTVSQRAVHVTRYDRESGWKGVDLENLHEALALPSLGAKASIPLAEICRWTPLGRT
jgi:Uma2 family endonuclease